MPLLSETFNGSLPPDGWSLVDAGDLMNSVAGYSSNCADCTNSALAYGGWTSPTFAVTTNITLSFRFKSDLFMYLGGYPILTLLNGTTPLLSIESQTGFTAQLMINSYSDTTPSLVATTSSSLSDSTWHLLELSCNLISSGTASLSINGVSEISEASGNFANGTAGATLLKLVTAPFTHMFYDELVLSAVTSSSHLTLIRRNPGGFKKLGL